MKLLDLVIEVGRVHRAPSGIWCIPDVKNSSGERFVIHETVAEYECLTCNKRWDFKR